MRALYFALQWLSWLPSCTMLTLGVCISWCSSIGKLWDARCPTLDSSQVHTVEHNENGSKSDTCTSLVSISMTQERT